MDVVLKLRMQFPFVEISNIYFNLRMFVGVGMTTISEADAGSMDAGAGRYPDSGLRVRAS